ncbi:hypothetical protein CC78DRAFT_66489 [Lojkania enalia]|uniref:Uncharacterized protein n=1 Tax=Lojkania enalia TaxID=147567 RepID=A0A9P4JZM0_9PLEO|nr:hypothetical protein CC78DRAFT_66489 [Didymosphaeria enalia]
MAGPVMNFRILTKSPSHTLRAIPLAIFAPAFLMLLIQGIASSRVNPAIGIIPLFFSAAYSAALLANEKKCGCQSSGLSGTPLHLVCDFALGVGTLVCLILTWIFLPHHTWEISGGLVMLGTYASNFLIINFLIHLFFTAKQLWEFITPGEHYVSSCPYCRHGSFVSSIAQAAKGFAPLLDTEGRPSAAEEGERAEAADSAV